MQYSIGKHFRESVFALSRQARHKRGELFRGAFLLDESTTILDLGSESGSSIHALLQGTAVNPANVYIADIDSEHLQRGHERFGFVPVLIGESKDLPFPDQHFDIVYCSSVIEHVTLPKESIWTTFSGKQFRHASLARQKEFASEIRRTAKQYFVQTPYKHFPIESHSWLPFVAWLPRRLLIPLLRFSNSFWIKTTKPDWHLLNKKQLANLFDDAQIVSESFFGFTKSIMAIKTNGQNSRECKDTPMVNTNGPGRGQ